MTGFTRAYGARSPADVAIEQARARGLTVDQTAADLDVDVEVVQSIWAAMDAVAGSGDPRVNHPRRHSTAVHGTYARFQAHRSRGEEACDPCREARARYDQQRTRPHRVRAAS